MMPSERLRKLTRRRDEPVPYAGCYTLHLFCDSDLDVWEHNYFCEATGQTLYNCLKQARAIGWVIHADRTATCPACNNRRTLKTR